MADFLDMGSAIHRNFHRRWMGQVSQNSRDKKDGNPDREHASGATRLLHIFSETAEEIDAAGR
jgi:hypothetical protein